MARHYFGGDLLGRSLRRLLAGLRYGAKLLGYEPVIREAWLFMAPKRILCSGVAGRRRGAPNTLYLEFLEQRQLMSATFGAAATSPIAGGSLAQYVLTRSDPGTATVSHVAIDWGDGQNSSASSLVSVLDLTHIYSSASTYIITATITDTDGTHYAPNITFVVSSTTWSLTSGQVVLDTTAPNTITDFAMSSVTDSSVTLGWDTATDNVGVNRIRILRNGVPVADLAGTATSYTDLGLQPDVTYGYSAVAYDLAGNASTPATASATSGVDYNAPNTPTGFTTTLATVADGTASSEVILQWLPASDNGGGGVVGYHLYRSDVDYGSTPLSGLIAGTTYTDTTMPDTWTTSYASVYYTLAAVDADGNESWGRASLTVIPSNISTPNPPNRNFELEQYIPQVYQDYVNNLDDAAVNDLTSRYRELVDQAQYINYLQPPYPAPAQGWLDPSWNSGLIVSSYAPPDAVFVDNGSGQEWSWLSRIPNSNFEDLNNNFRFDPGEPAWVDAGSSTYRAGISTPISGTPTDGMTASDYSYGGPYYLPSGNSAYSIDPVLGYNSGDEILADLTQIKGTSDGTYLYFDANGNGKWDPGTNGSQGEPVWLDNNSDGYYESSDTVIFAGSDTLYEGQFGKSNGINYADVDGKRIVWADQSSFFQDVANLYAGIDALAATTSLSVVASAAGTLTGTGTVAISTTTLSGTGSHFLTELASNDWIKIGTSSWFRVTEVLSDTSAELLWEPALDGLTVSGTLNYTGWTLIPEVDDPEPDTGLTFAYQRGQPGSDAEGSSYFDTNPLFPQNFAELHDALATLSDGLTLSTGLDAAPTLTLSHSNEMDLRNVVADSNLDGILSVGADLTGFGNSTGVIVADPQRGMGQVYLPIDVDNTGVLPINGYLLQGAFGAAQDDPAGSLASQETPYSDVGPGGLSWGYSLNEHVAINLYINSPQNHIARMTVYRPGGNAVTFDFAWDPTTQTFSEWGYPVGARDDERTYVLHATAVDFEGNTTPGFFDQFLSPFYGGYSPDPLMPANFELRFADGTVHVFDQSGALSSVRTADGVSVSISSQLSGSTGTPMTASSIQYNVNLNYTDGHLASVIYDNKGFAGATDSITTALSYIDAGNGLSLVTGLSKHVDTDEPFTGGVSLSVDMPEFSWYVSGATTGNDTNTVTLINNDSHNTTTRSGSAGDFTIEYDTDGVSSSDEYIYNASGMLTSFIHSLGGSTATTNYSYDEGTDRYSLTGVAQWGQLTQVEYPDGYWEGYTYDHNGSTGWMTAYITPFKDTAAPGAFSAYVTGHAGVLVETYYYDSSASGGDATQAPGGGDAVDPTAMLQNPREIVYTTNNVILGVEFDKYILQDAGYGSVPSKTTRQGEFLTLDSGDLSSFTWDDAGMDTLYVYGGTHGQSLTSESSALGRTTYAVSTGYDGTYTISTVSYGPDGAERSFGSETFSPAGIVIDAATTDYLFYIPTQDVSSTTNGFGYPLSTYDAIADTYTEFSSVDGGSVSWFGPLLATNSDGIVTSTVYDPLGRVHSTTTLGITTTNAYDGDWNLIASTESAGTLTSSIAATYDAQDRPLTQTNEIGKVTNYAYSLASGVLTTTQTYNYGSTDNAQIITQTYIDGSQKSVSGDATDRVNYDYGVNATAGYFQRTISNTGNTDTTATTSGFVSTSYYNSLWQDYRDESSNGTNGTLVSLTMYDAYGRVIETRDLAQGSRSVTEYDPATGDVIDTLSTSAGNLTESGGVSTFGYDGLDEGEHYNLPYTGAAQTTTTIENGTMTGIMATSISGTTSWSADMNVGGAAAVLTSTTNTVIDPDTKSNWVTTTAYSDGTESLSIYEGDLLTRTESLSAPDGGGHRTVLAQSDYTYDAFFRTHSVTTLTSGTAGTPTSLTATYIYRANGQVQETDYSDGTSVVVNDWSGATDQPTSTTGRDGTTVLQTFNAKGEVTSTSGGGNTPVTMNNNATMGIYTLTTYKDGDFAHNGTTNAATTTWNSDPTTGQLTSKVYADGSSMSYFYNASGQLYQSVQAMSGHSGDTVTATYGYTADGMQNSVTYTQSSADTISYTTDAFDAYGNPTLITEAITPAGGTSGVQTMLEQLGYDAGNHQLTSETFNYATNGTTSFNLTLSYSHTDATFGDLTGISLNTQNGTDSGTAVSIVSANYSYNDAGQLSSVIGNATTSFTYDEGTGNQSGVDTAYGSGTASGDIVTTDQYNASNGHLESIVTTRGATTIYEEDLTYPAPGSAHYDQISRAQITALVLSGTASITAHYYIAYGYDSQNQLTGMVTYNGVYGSTESHFTIASESFAYDSLGNRTDLNASGTANIDIMNQYLADAASHSLTYDARGNLTGTYDYAYTYDELNRMTSATPTNHASDKAVYTYDFQNNRTSETLYAWDSGMGGAGDWSTTAASVTQYLYNGQMLMAEINGLTGKMTKSYEWDPTKPNGVGGLLCIITYDTDGVTVTGRYRPVYDANANVVALTDLSTGAVVANYSYTAFGICTASGTNADVCNFRFGGMYWQAGAEQYYDKARDYDPVLGRFMQRDPSGEGGGDNLDAYCGNNPIGHEDPTGLYDPQGHFYTTYLVAIAAGWNEADAYTLAYYSQLPDQIPDFDAQTQGSIAISELSAWSVKQTIYDEIPVRLRFGLMPPAPVDLTWEIKIYWYLHSLTGGDQTAIINRRTGLASLLVGDKLTQDWQKGFVVHALGDAFAHTFTDKTGLHAFGFPEGHALVTPNPDLLGTDPSKYSSYVSLLYGLLSYLKPAVAKSNPALLGQVINVATQSSKLGWSEPQEEAALLAIAEAGHDSSGALRKYQPTAIPAKGFGGVVGKTGALDPALATPSHADVDALLNIIASLP